MKNWRLVGNKITLPGQDKPMTGRQYKYQQELLGTLPAYPSKLLSNLIKQVPYNSPYQETENDYSN